MFSKACEYSIRASIFIAEQSKLGRKVSSKEVAEAIESPTLILQKLTRNNIINSDKGPKGGFSMNKQELDNVELSTIVSAIDGEDIYIGCGSSLKQSNENKPCPVLNQFIMIRDELKKMLETATISALAVDYENGLTFLKR